MSSRLLAGVGLVAVAGLAGCTEDGSVDSGSCSGSQTGQGVMAGVDGRMDDGNAVRIASIADDDDPPYVRFSLGQATAAETAAAEHVEIGDTFALGASTYELVGICADRAFLQTQ